MASDQEKTDIDKKRQAPDHEDISRITRQRTCGLRLQFNDKQRRINDFFSSDSSASNVKND